MYRWNFLKWTKPYIELARYQRPIGIWLLFLPALWGFALAYKGLPPLLYFLLFLLGAALMRGAGCIVNDMTDRKYDGKVARTQLRPLVSGALSLKQAALWLGIHLLFAAMILFQFNRTTIFLGFLALILTVAYPWMKRITYWPQVFLGFTFNWGLVMAFASANVEVRVSVLLIYTAGILWTLAYDTIYAYQDHQDDVLIGVKSSALALKNHARPFLLGCYGLQILLMVVAGWLENLFWGYYVILAIAATQLAWQVYKFDAINPILCRRLFCSNQWVGLLIWLALIVGYEQAFARVL